MDRGKGAEVDAAQRPADIRTQTRGCTDGQKMKCNMWSPRFYQLQPTAHHSQQIGNSKGKRKTCKDISKEKKDTNRRLEREVGKIQDDGGLGVTKNVKGEGRKEKRKEKSEKHQHRKKGAPPINRVD